MFFHVANESMTALESPKHSLFAERHISSRTWSG